LFTLIACSPQLLPTGHMVVPELSCARRWEPGPRGMWRSRIYRGPWWQELEPRGMQRSRSCPMPGDGSRGHGACGGPRAVTVPELSCARRREPRDTLAGAPVLPFVFDLKLVRGGTRCLGYRHRRPRSFITNIVTSNHSCNQLYPVDL
jgi:hypothetical protein